MKRPTILSEWKEFSAGVVPKNASAIQRSEMRRAFYGGFISMMFICLRIGQDDVIEEEGIGLIEDLRCESERYLEDLKAGRV